MVSFYTKQLAYKTVRQYILVGLLIGFGITSLGAKSIETEILTSSSTARDGAVVKQEVYNFRTLLAPNNDGYTTPITFDEYPLNEVISDQYAQIGVIFGPDQAFISSDWANPGAQTKPMYRILRVADLSIQQPQIPAFSSTPFSDNKYFENLTNSTLAGFAYIGGYSDDMVDENGDGIADYLSIKLKFRFPSDTKYELNGYLFDSRQRPVALAATHAEADAGDNILELRFNATYLKTYGTNGAFYLKWTTLRLIDNFGDSSPITTNVVDGYITKNYNLDKVPLQPILFTGENFSDRGIDTNGNGLYEQIEVTIETTVNKAGTYIITAHAGCLYGEKSLFLQPGKHKVSVLLDTKEAVNLRCEDAFVLYEIAAYDTDDNRIVYARPNYRLQTQGFEKLEKPNVFVDEGSFEDYLVDLDGEQGADFIALDVNITVNVAGEYSVHYDIVDKDDNLIAQMEHYLDFTKGNRRLYLSIPTDPMYQKQIDGPYFIKFFRVDDVNHITIDSLQLFAYETKPYRWNTYPAVLKQQKKPSEIAL